MTAGSVDVPVTRLLARMQLSTTRLCRTERRVADVILADPRQSVRKSIAALANEAGVSQPMVIRFCQALGCKGLVDFKLRLAAELGDEAPALQTVSPTDTPAQYSTKMLGNAAAMLLELREQVDAGALEEARQQLGKARRVDCHALVADASLAESLRMRLLAAGLPSSVFTDPQARQLALGLPEAGALLLLIGDCSLPRRALTAWQAGGGLLLALGEQAPMGQMLRLPRLAGVDTASNATDSLRHLLTYLVVDLLLGMVARDRCGRVCA